MKNSEAIRKLRATMRDIATHVIKVSDSLDEKQLEIMLNMLIEARERKSRVMVIGAGRSGLVGKAFAMRLMHLGFIVYVIGETITPSLKEGDVLIAISGSGQTQVVVTASHAAKKMGAKVIAITSYPDSPLARISDHIVFIPGRTKIAKELDYFARQILGIYEPLAPLGTQFEDTTMIFFDGVIVALMNKLGISEKEMWQRHANVEIPS